MFVFFALLAVICIEISVLVRCQFIKNKHCRRVVCVITALIIAVSSAVFVIDFVSYLKGGTTTTDKISMSQTKITKSLDYFTVNGTYWSVGGHFQENEMLLSTKQKYTEFKIMPLDGLTKQHEFIIHYLPASKFIIKLEVPMIDGNLDVSNYKLLESGYHMYENKLMSYVAVLSFVMMITVIIVTIIRSRKLRREFV